MTRDEAYQIVTTLIKNPNLIKHHLAAEAAMKALGLKFKLMNPQANINEDDWALVGLLHDVDYELVKDQPERHTAVTEEKIGKLVSPEIMYAIKSHAYKYNANGVEPKSLMDWSIYTCDELTGFIIAVALIKPDKKLASVDVDSVLKKMGEPGFARAVDRNQIKLCEEKLNIPLNEFIGITIKAMQSISNDLGL